MRENNTENACLLEIRGEREASTNACISVQSKKYIQLATFFLADIFRVYATTQVLIQILVFQLVRDHLPDSLRKDATFNAEALFSTAGTLALFSMILNVREKYKSGRGSNFLEKYESGQYPAVETFVFAFLSGSKGVVLFDLFDPIITNYSTNKRIDREIACWILGGIGVVVAGVFIALKLASQNTSDEFIFKNFSKKSGPAYQGVSHGERILNAIGGAGLGSAAASIFAWAVNREINNGTVEGSKLEMGLVIGIALVSGVFGAVATTDYPKLFHAFVALSKFFYGAAVGVASASGIHFFMPDALQTKEFYLGFLKVNALFVGILNALVTKYRFEKEHEVNKQLLELIASIPAKIKPCCLRFSFPRVGFFKSERESGAGVASSLDHSLSSPCEKVYTQNT